MGKFKLISTNIITAIVTAALTSAFWMIPINPYPLLAGRSAR